MSNKYSIQIVPSVLPADFSDLGAECKKLEEAGADKIQFDVMDGNFVPNITFGADVIKSLRDKTTLPFEAHLMISKPEVFVDDFIASGCEMIIIHQETSNHLHRLLSYIKSTGTKCGLALNPQTEVTSIENLIDLLDLVLIMTVNPGFGGQRHIDSTHSKIKQAKEMIDDSQYQIDLEVDGGINPETILECSKAGANVFISGSSIYKNPSGLKAAISELRKIAESNYLTS